MSNPIRWLRGSGSGRVAIDLPEVRAHFADQAARLADKLIEPELVRARFADRLRDVKFPPPKPDTFETLGDRLIEEEWRRVALAVSALDLQKVREAVPKLCEDRGMAEWMRDGFFELARETPLLTMELLRQSPLRVEEFARHFLMRIGAAVANETAEQSRKRLERLDYTRLLAEAERAKQSAEERAAYLRKMQEEEQRRRPRRGKW